MAHVVETAAPRVERSPRRPVRAFVGLGSNLGDPAAQLAAALHDIAAADGVRLMRRSSLYRSAPVGYEAQPDYVNAAAEVLTRLSPTRLLALLQAIELRHGRRRSFRNAPRTLDLDLLLYGDLQWHDETLILPHPRAHERAFVLQPLFEIAPDCVIPGVGPVRDRLEECRDQRIVRLVPVHPRTRATPAWVPAPRAL